MLYLFEKVRFGEPVGTFTEWLVIDGNRCDDVGIQIYEGSRHVMIRNNAIERTGIGETDIFTNVELR